MYFVYSACKKKKELVQFKLCKVFFKAINARVRVRNTNFKF